MKEAGELFRRTTLCVVGNVNRDVRVHQAPGSSSLLRDGETSVPAITETIGGGGANSACAAAALGGHVHFVGKIGADALGHQVQHALERHGVMTSLTQDSKCVTGTTVALGFETGHRHFLSCLPNNQNLRFEDLDLSALKKCEHLLRADVWFSLEMLETGNERLLQRAREQKLKTSLDINYDPVWSRGTQREIRHRKRMLRKVMPLVDLAHGNARELCEFSDAADLQTALRKLSQWGARSLVVHLGKKGAGFYADGKWIIEPANPAKRSVHATGTGDVLSISMIMLTANQDLSVTQKLRLSNRIVREYMEGRLHLIPEL
jgi:sugar/nucleoside kinase (ribokinase family)